MNELHGGDGLQAMTDLVYPHLKWGEDDYARLEARLDLYTDFVVLSRFRAGQVVQQYLVDPDEVASALAAQTLASGLLPRGCFFWSKQAGREALGVYVPPQVWPVSIRGEEQAWRVPLPGLVFTGHDYDYRLWAVTDRPTDPHCPLYLAPCPNVHPEGVCRGSAPFPLAGNATIWQAVDIFFSSRFNADLSQGKSRQYPDCILDQWRALHRAGAESYPLDDLVEARLSLGRISDV